MAGSAWIERRPTRTGAPRYRVKFTLGGRRARSRYAGSFKTKAEAKTRRDWVAGELAALRVPNVRQLAEPERAPTVAEAAARWQASRVDVAEATRLQHRTAIRKLLPILGHLHLDEIEAQHVAAMVGRLHGENAKRESIRKVVTALAMALDHAGVSPNPARDKVTIKLPREEPEEPNPPTADHVVAVYRLLPSKHRLPLLWLDWSGARLASVDETLVGDYDERRRRVRLRAAVTKSRRALWVELPDVLADAVEATLGPREDRDPDARLFAGSGGDALRTGIAKACRAAAVPAFSPHDLRHRRVSLLHLRGVPWARIGEFVGQRSLRVTAETYTHVLTDESEVDYAELLA